MAGIFGIFRRDGAPATGALEVMRRALAAETAAPYATWTHGSAGLGHTGCHGALHPDAGGFVLAATGRLDAQTRPLSAAIQDAHRTWGAQAPDRLSGDWAYAAWHPAERRFHLARDRYGFTSMYYLLDHRVFAFASSRRPLLALGLVPVEVDELYLAQMLVAWPAYHGQRTAHAHLRRLPPAHQLTVTQRDDRLRRYWHLEDVPELRLPSRADYAAALRDVFDRAVRDRLRGAFGAAQTPTAVTLSGGLDSGSVAATAATDPESKLIAFTSVPLTDPGVYVGDRFGDELPLAQATARRAGIELRTVTARDITPIQAVRRMLRVRGEPVHAAANAYWLLALFDAVREAGCGLLLTGQAGNHTISWEGDPTSQPLPFRLRTLGWRGTVPRMLPPLSSLRGAARRDGPMPWRAWSPIHPAFARRLGLLDLWRDAPDRRPAAGPVQRRLRMLRLGRSVLGAAWDEMGRAHGALVTDPTADVRVIEFALSVPDDVFIDPATGLDRWLVREAMRGRLPDEVRLNRARGRQAGDLIPRLRASAPEVEDALDELERGPAAEVVDAAWMREAWAAVLAEDRQETHRLAGAVLLRGVMAGLFVNEAGRTGSGREPLSAPHD